MAHEAENTHYVTLYGKSADPCTDRLTLGYLFKAFWGRVPGSGAVIEEAAVCMFWGEQM